MKYTEVHKQTAKKRTSSN